MSADAITPIPPGATAGDDTGGGAGRGGSHTSSGAPLVVVQQPRGASPPRPAPRPAPASTDTTLRNGYAAISHSVSSETAAIGLGFLVGGPAGAVVAGATLPVLVVASMWRARRREHDEQANAAANEPNAGRDRAGRDRSSSGGDGRRRSSNGPNGSGGGGGGGRPKTPKGPGPNGDRQRKPRVKDPVAEKLLKGLDKLKPNKGSRDLKGPKNKTPKDEAGKGLKGPKSGGDGSGAKGRKDGSKDRGPQPSSDKPWRGRGDKPGKAKKDKAGKDSGTSSATSRDGLDPKKPKGPKGGGVEVFDAEIVDDGLPPKPNRAPDDVIDGEIINDRIELVKKAREKKRRRAALTAGRRAEEDAARDGTQGDPRTVKLQVIREANARIDLELQRTNELLALAAGTEQRRSTPVTYPVATVQPAGTRTAGVAVARQIDPRGSAAYQLLVAMAEQLANGLPGDADADMADHVVELVGIPAMCRRLSTAVRQGAAALQTTAPLHPSVIKHLNNAAVAAATAARMADTIIVVFVDAHRADIYRVMEPRIGEERWNIRNSGGTLDGARLRAAIMAAGQQRLALPAGSSQATGGKVVPASHASTKRLIKLMSGFDRGHMVLCLSEVAGAASGVEVVANSVTRLYRRMAKTWPTEDVVDQTVRLTAAKVGSVAAELRKAIVAAQRAHQRELSLNAKPRKGPQAETKWDVAKGRKG